ncbi:hypothetical protein GJ496_006120 [Pomphorhynchus laevis]|nr:hypothetical protein GJ496_006120 [Pomphorhynchus laevis]
MIMTADQIRPSKEETSNLFDKLKHFKYALLCFGIIFAMSISITVNNITIYRIENRLQSLEDILFREHSLELVVKDAYKDITYDEDDKHTAHLGVRFVRSSPSNRVNSKSSQFEYNKKLDIQKPITVPLSISSTTVRSICSKMHQSCAIYAKYLIKGIKGDRGERGYIGLRGFKGQKGECINKEILKGEKGEKGESGYFEFGQFPSYRSVDYNERWPEMNYTPPHQLRLTSRTVCGEAKILDWLSKPMVLVKLPQSNDSSMNKYGAAMKDSMPINRNVQHFTYSTRGYIEVFFEEVSFEEVFFTLDNWLQTF